MSKKSLAKDTEQPNSSGNIEKVRLGDLAIAPENIRFNDRADQPEEISQLAESIFARGLLENLVGYRDGDAVMITAGRRRFKALTWLACKEGNNRLDADHMLNVLIRDREHAIADSLAENSHRKIMTVSQEIAAYRALVEDGHTDKMIARKHGTSILRVRMFLRLAKVAPSILKAFAADEMGLETLKAFAARDDQKRQRAVFKQWKEAQHSWYSHAIRKEMLRDTLDPDDPIALFVGTEKYVAAGGKLEVDLFTEDHDAAWLDVDLANRLASEKILAEAESLKNSEEWKWFEVLLDPNFSVDDNLYARVYPENLTWSKVDLDRVAELEMLVDDNPNDPALMSEWREIETRYLPPYPADARRIGGFIATIDHSGELMVWRGLIARKDAPTKIKRRTDEPKFTYINPNIKKPDGSDRTLAGNSGKKSESDKPHYTNKHLDRLRPIRRAAFQEALANSPALAFDLCAFDLARNVVSQYMTGCTPLNLCIREMTETYPSFSNDEEFTFYDGFSRIADTLPADWIGNSEDETSDLDVQFASFRTMSKEDKERWMAFAVASSADIDVAIERDNHHSSAQFAEKIALEAQADIRKSWTPDGAYFQLYRKKLLLEILCELLGGNNCDDLKIAQKQNKAALANDIGLMFTCEITRSALTEPVLQRVDQWRPLGTHFDREAVSQ